MSGLEKNVSHKTAETVKTFLIMNVENTKIPVQKTITKNA